MKQISSNAYIQQNFLRTKINGTGSKGWKCFGTGDKGDLSFFVCGDNRIRIIE
jgi:hypothetical protein